MKITGNTTKSKAMEIALALPETERRAKIKRFVTAKVIPTGEWSGAVDPAYDLTALRAAEKRTSYRNKRGLR